MEAETDRLTGLRSRREFQKHLEMAVTADAPLSILLIDLDRLANLNHDFTHHAGDSVLCSLARFLEQKVRATDGVFRYGGNEFTILLPETPLGEAKAIAEQIRTDISDKSWSSHAITVSIGMASLMPEQESWQDVIEAAEAAIHEAKMAGGNCVRPV